RAVEVLAAPVHPQCDLRVSVEHLLCLRAVEKRSWNLLLDPKDKVFFRLAREQLGLDTIDAVDPISFVPEQEPCPKTRTDVEGVVGVLRGDEDIGVQAVDDGLLHGSGPPSRRPYSWKAPPRIPVRS